MDSLLIGIGAAVIVVAAVWIINSNRSPLWRALDRRPRRLESANLTEWFNGLVRFGMEGAYFAIRESRSGDEMRFVKRMHGPSFSIDVLVEAAESESELRSRIESAMGPLGNRIRAEFVPRRDSKSGIEMSLTGESLGDPPALEGLAILLIRCLGHSDDSRYRILHEGPSDYAAVADYFGLSN